MTDETDAGATPATPGAMPTEPEAPLPAAATADADKLGEPGLAALKSEREQREAAERREKKLILELKAYQDADKTEAQKATERIAELEREKADLIASATENTVRMAVLDTAARLGFRSPELAYRALDHAALEFKDDGTPRNVEKLLNELLAREPYLGKPAGAPDFGGGPRGRTPPNTPGMNELLRAARGG
jgi:hypothetical protein